jgi:hypothetical protein
MKLRKVIRATGLAVLAILGGCDTQVDEPYLVELLFVQHANSVVLENGQLILEGISRDVLYFSDRPERIVGREPVEVFVDAWDDGEESFEVIPPNAILTVVTDGKPLDLAVVLKNPVLSGYSMIYDVEVLVGPDSGRGGKAALFIDAFGMELGRPGRPGLGAEPGIPGAEVGRALADRDWARSREFRVLNRVAPGVRAWVRSLEFPAASLGVVGMPVDGVLVGALATFTAAADSIGDSSGQFQWPSRTAFSQQGIEPRRWCPLPG